MVQNLDENEDEFFDDFDDDVIESDPWDSTDRERIAQVVAMSYMRNDKKPLVQHLRDAQLDVFKNQPRKIREIVKVPPWLSKRIKKESSPTEIMFLLVDSLVKQLESQGQTLELLFEASDGSADRLETLEHEIRDRMTSVEDQLRRIRERFNVEPPLVVSRTPTQSRPTIAIVGLYPDQYSQVLNHCKRQNIDASRADLILAPKDTWSLPDICHFAILSQWAGRGWDEIIREKNKSQPSNPRTVVVHETKGLPMIALRIAECIARFNQHVTQ